jgi:DNA-binding CsgD family transcriptional regulator
MVRSVAILDVVDAVYAAAIDPSVWDDALRALAHALGATAAGLHIERAGVAVTQRWVGLEVQFIEPYRAHYWQRDPWARGSRTLHAGEVGVGERLVARPTLEKSAFYNELSRPFEIDDLMAAAVERTPHRQTFVSVVGGLRKRFDGADALALRMLVPHLRRALEIGERLQTFPLDTPPSLEGELCIHFGLTPAEARVALRVGRGLAPKEAAMALGTSWNTVRFQLRCVYAKTRTNGKSELARLVQRLELGARLEG